MIGYLNHFYLKTKSREFGKATEVNSFLQAPFGVVPFFEPSLLTPYGFCHSSSAVCADSRTSITQLFLVMMRSLAVLILLFC